MWRLVSLWLFVFFVCLISVSAQTVSETESSISLTETTAEVSLLIENPGKSFDTRLELKLLDPENESRAALSQNLRVKPGREIYKFTLTLPGDLLKKAETQIPWYRLQYRVGNKTAGIVSLSELLKDVFDLRIAASENISFGTTYRVRVRALQSFTKQPVENVKIEGELELDIDTEADDDTLNLKMSGATDAEGFAVLDFKIPAGIKFEDDGDLTITGRKSGVVREISEDLDSDEKPNSVFLTADKPLYQPGQNLSVRALYFDASRQVVAGSEIQFSVKDEDGIVLYRETAKTSDYGIASVSWKIPENAKLGSYRVEVETDDEIDEDTLYFKVSRYDLPQFTVAAAPDKSFYLPDDKTAEIAVNAAYLFGKPVTKGRVRVVEESERHWNYKEQKYDITEKQSFEGETDASGKFVAKVDLSEAFDDLKNGDWQRFNDLNFAAYFTDATTNRTEQRRFDLRLSKEPIHVYLIGKTADQNPKLPVTAYVSTFYADGTPAVCDAEVTGKYENEEKEEIIARLKTNRLGAGKIVFSKPRGNDSNNDLRVKISARDGDNRRGTAEEEIDFEDEEAVKIETEKTIFKPGEPVKIKLVSTEKEALVYLDVVKDWMAIDSYFVRLKNGRGELKIPYNPNFKGELTLSAYTDESDGYYDTRMRHSRGIIFPAQQNLKIDARFSSEEYRPNEEAKVDFSLFNNTGKAIEGALGVVVFDKAIEERARTDAEFGSYFSRFGRWLGYEKSFGNLTLKDLNELDLSKNVSPEVQLAAEIMLAYNYHYPQIHHSEINKTEAKSLYAEFFRKQLAPVEQVLRAADAKNYEHPTDIESLRKILAADKIDFDALRDPWGQNYQPLFSIDKTQNILTFRSSGADKKPGTEDDFTVSSLNFSYFAPHAETIGTAVREYHRRTGGYIRDAATLAAELARQNVDLNRIIKDRWNRDYRITFEVSGRNYLIRFHSNGANGVYEPTYYASDDFTVWTSAIDYFAETEARINGILSRTVNAGKREFPKDTDEFKQFLKENDFDLDRVRDGYGEPVYLAFGKQFRYADKTKVENGKQTITPVTEELTIFTVRSKGADNKNSTAPEFADDFDLATFSSVVSVQSKDTRYEKADIKNIAMSGSVMGAIRGVVYDPNDAVIPNAIVTAATGAAATPKTFSTTTNGNGEFLLENLPPGMYSLKAEAPGFKTTLYENIQVRSQNLIEVKFNLNVGDTSATVNVMSETVTVSASSSQISNLPVNGRNVSGLLALKPGVAGKDGEKVIEQNEQTSTPRLREYFPETLFWQPELITDKNGRAEVKFKFADNITTWKLYGIASTKNGRIGVAEKEVKVFQPFFVDLEPPKFLTEGDEISLPVQIRNYTERKQKVDVSMAEGDWFSFLNSARRQIEVPAGDTQNAIFGFKANSFVKDGKQRVTALAQKDSDAVEKPVTVRPNGQEITRTDSKFSSGAASFEIKFPVDALPKTRQAELKIYPNLFSHVSESVEGLLQRPYGCGEQTISSTYPNAMILKFVRENNPLRQKAQKYLQKGYERLLGYQTASGGFSYWGAQDQPDIALTAYALRFLNDARTFVEVDPQVFERAQNWLVRQQRADGGWEKRYYQSSAAADERQTKLFTAYIARTLAMRKTQNGAATGNDNGGEADAALQKALDYLKKRGGEIDEPFILASFALALFDAGDRAAAGAATAKLRSLAISEGDAAYWKLETNTPFYGWGTPGRIETTALVVQALTKEENQAANRDLISRGTMFLLKNKDRYGVWYSTQTTVNVLDAFLATLGESGKSAAAAQTLQVVLNGENVQTISVAPDKIEPIPVDLTGRIDSLAASRLEVKNSSGLPVMSQLVQTHYIDWKNSSAAGQTANESRAVRLDYKCDRTEAAIMQNVNCAVSVERVGFKGYGMLLAEIGLPPGADVSRESLEEAIKDNRALSRYEVLPDRIIVYLWAQPAGGTRFDFKFRPRYGVRAQTPASIAYDYYNPEAQATLAPLKFNVK